MAAEVPYLSRFLVKFVEILGAGFASAICAYLLAHFGGVLLPSSAPAPSAVQATPGAAADVIRAVAAPPVAAAAANAPQPAPGETARPAPPAAKAEPARTLPPQPEGRTDRGAAEKKTDKSAEALARAALAKMDAERRSPAAPPIPRPVQARQAAADVELRRTDPRPASAESPPQRAVAPPRAAAAIETAPRPTEVRPQPAQPQPVGAAHPLRSPEVPPAPAVPAGVESRPPAAAEVLPAGTGASETSAPTQAPSADHHGGVLSALGQIPGLLRPDPPPLPGEAPRPPAPVGTAPRE